MRFLDTSTGMFLWINDPRHVRYAILSHTWGMAEQTYEDIKRLQAEAISAAKVESRSHTAPEDSISPPSILAHPELSDKIAGACRAAREAGYELLWLDAACINKSSSAELSEAINSMYLWYAVADVCLVYLSDVPDDDNVRAWNSCFRMSRWHTRGWTLQELIAPRRVVFLSRKWRLLGSKMTLANLLQEITRVDATILTGVTTLNSVSVYHRMSWASQRETTRVEDKAYSLLGIFGVHMSPIYGEGSHAFIRLQEEIIRTIPDQSIFAWGPRQFLGARAGLASSDASAPFHEHERGLLAKSPEDFASTHDATVMSPAELAYSVGRVIQLPPLQCAFTPEGVRVRLCCIDIRIPEDVAPDIGAGSRQEEKRGRIRAS
ncbi:HET-domain-containing protein [Trametes cingulata]|nr:HET-domain-containing protein [Trametes cingulata]